MEMDSGHNIHRRKPSKDEDENVVIVSPPLDPAPATADAVLNGFSHLAAPPLPRNRVMSSPSHPQQLSHGHSLSVNASGGHLHGHQPPSAGPYRAGFNLPRPLNGINGHPSSPFRSSFAMPSVNGAGHNHSRTRSISTPFSPPLPSPLHSSFPTSASSPTSNHHHIPPFMSTSHSSPDSLPGSDSSPKQPRRHSRLHSRNLSVFFPRPGSLPQSTISEDGVQEIELHESVDEEAPVSTIPPAGPSISLPNGRRGHGGKHPPTPLGAGFTFGTRPPSMGPAPPLMAGDSMDSSSHSTASSRRGHHHKHSMSHNFFSFLEPGTGGRLANGEGEEEELHTQPTPMPVSPWTPVSGFPGSVSPSHSHSHGTEAQNGHSHSPDTHATNGHYDHGHNLNHHHMKGQVIPPGAASFALAQFVLGAWLWVCGQQIGSLSCTGLGYWVVFDAFGVGIQWVLPGWLGGKGGQSVRAKRPYGNARIETVFMFAQAVYLMFSSVYVCKETVEHLLLSAGGGEGHHHHHGDEEPLVGIEFPIFLTFITFLSLGAAAYLFDNHSKLVHITGSRIPPLNSLIRSMSSSRNTHRHNPPPTSRIGIMLSNPYIASPLFFCLAILSVVLFVPASQHRMCDLILAGLVTVVTFNVAYRASVVLGTVLLQTAPPRGLAGGRMEAFLRAMRELERHPQVLHLPAPHIWQLTPTPASASAPANGAESLVVTLELHVREDMGDDDVLKLTKWAWERCVGALGGGAGGKGLQTGSGGPEVTVGVVRG